MTKQSPRIDSLWIALTALLVLLPGCNRFCEAECADEGHCNIRTYRAGDALYRCYAGTDADCQDSRACREEGRCFATEQGICVLEEDVAGQACATSTWCSRSGMCGHQDGVCWANSDANCEASFECRTVGRCGARGGVCIPFNNTHCQESLGCEIEGLCERATYLRLGYDCRVPLDDATACEQSWVCEHYGRCAPALTANCEGCRFGFCAEPGRPAVLACSPAAAVIPACSADGRCAPDANYECAHAPVGGPGTTTVAEVGDVATGADKPDALPQETAKPETPLVAPQEASTIGANLGNSQADEATSIPAGPGAVAFALDPLAERSFDGLLTYATVLTGASGFEAEPIDFLVLRATPEEGCNPRSSSAFLPLGAIWLIGALPDSEGTFSFEGGPMPGQMSAKTWLWTGDRDSGSRNLAMHGTIEITSRSATEVRGNVDFRVTEYFSDISIGTVRGPFIANVVDCSTHTGGWPM